jgi:hypothetical protein
MAKFQFVHVETYAWKSYGKKKTIPDVLSEAMRLDGFCPHVQNPRAPEVLFSASGPIFDIPALIHDLARQEQDLRRQGIRPDAQLLAAPITSFPQPMELLLKSPSLWIEMKQWSELDLAWLRRRFPTLHTALRHNDEKFLHHHGYALPFLTPNGLSLGDMHPGQKAGLEARAEAKRTRGLKHDDPEMKLVYNTAYKAAMSKLQEEYWIEVGMPMGMAWKGANPRPRVDRKTYLAQQELAEAREDARQAKEALEIATEELARVNSNIEFIKMKGLNRNG